MLRINRLFSIFLLVALIFSACQPITRPAAVAPQGLRPDAPPYAVHGPYGVGVRDFKIEATQANERSLTITIWYPALNPKGVEASVIYTMGFPDGQTPNFPVYGHALLDAQPATATGPYPLVVHTHAHWSFRQETPYIDEHLASIGFVVISADHEDNWSTLSGPKPWQVEFRRPQEIRREIDYAANLNTGGPLNGLIDTQHVGVFGWSGGGETALEMGGARLDFASFRTWCETNKVNGKFPDDDCVDILDHEAELATLAGLNTVPERLWPDWHDPRVAAVIGLAPWVGPFSAASLQNVKVPTLLMIGSSDTDAGATYFPLQPYQKIGTTQKSEVILENAVHMVFFSACRDAPDLVKLDFSAFCSDPVWDMDRAHDLINHFVTAFLLAELKGDKEAAKALAPANVAFTGIKYETTEFNK